jgi:hypothetical protein
VRIDDANTEPRPVLAAREREALGRALLDELGAHGCDHTARHTAQWALARGVDPGHLLARLAAAGFLCDCEIVNNACFDPDDGPAYPGRS